MRMEPLSGADRLAVSDITTNARQLTIPAGIRHGIRHKSDVRR
jgi:hypothetical protein